MAWRARVPRIFILSVTKDMLMASDRLSTDLDAHQLEELEKKYDSALNTRDNGPTLTRAIYWATILFAAYHVWTAGFGTPVDHVHMGCLLYTSPSPRD